VARASVIGQLEMRAPIEARGWSGALLEDFRVDVFITIAPMATSETTRIFWLTAVLWPSGHSNAAFAEQIELIPLVCFLLRKALVIALHALLKPSTK